MKAFFQTSKGAICALAVTLMCVLSADAQRISGIVTDAETSEALPGATVALQNKAGGIGSSARVTIRGERSLNINRNQPLFRQDYSERCSWGGHIFR